VSEKKPIDLNEIISKVEKFLVRVIGEDIKCSFALHNEPIVIYAEPHQLEQVLMNLATNARDAMAE
jgi:two-component system cell cycle sensor histidine kinase/response regulator CckA